MNQRAPTQFTTAPKKQAKTPVDNKQTSPGKQTSNAYFNYFSQRVPEHTNDTWVKVYLPLLKEINDGYERLPGSGRIRKQMNHDIKHNGIPITMRGQAWPLLIGNKSRVTAHLFEFYKSMPEKSNQVG